VSWRRTHSHPKRQPIARRQENLLSVTARLIATHNAHFGSNESEPETAHRPHFRRYSTRSSCSPSVGRSTGAACVLAPPAQPFRALGKSAIAHSPSRISTYPSSATQVVVIARPKANVPIAETRRNADDTALMVGKFLGSEDINTPLQIPGWMA
jgi:hypothetical protein